MNLYKLTATIAWCLLATGVVKRRSRLLHVRLMLSGIMLDLLLVLYLQLTRNAVQTALAFSLDFLSQLHIAASSLATVLYFPVIALGWVLFHRGSTPKLRIWHIRLAVTAFTFRSIGLVLMFFVTPQKH